MTTTKASKIDIVQEVISIIQDCKDTGMEHDINRQVCLWLKMEYGYDRSEATTLLIGAELIDELGLLLND